MIFDSVHQRVIEYFNRFNFETIDNSKSDPYVMVALVSENGQVQIAAHFLAKAASNKNSNRAPDCLRSTLKMVNKMFNRTPFNGVKISKANWGKHCCVACNIENEYLIVTVIADNESDADWVCKGIARLFVNF